MIQMYFSDTSFAIILNNLNVKPTSVQSLLEVKRGLMVVPKPTMLSMVPDGRLFSTTTMAS